MQCCRLYGVAFGTVGTVGTVDTIGTIVEIIIGKYLSDLIQLQNKQHDNLILQQGNLILQQGNLILQQGNLLLQQGNLLPLQSLRRHGGDKLSEDPYLNTLHFIVEAVNGDDITIREDITWVDSLGQNNPRRNTLYHVHCTSLRIVDE